MGTSAPAVREHDIPITKPYKPPLALPAPEPDKWVAPVPQVQPAKQPVRRKEHTDGLERLL